MYHLPSRQIYIVQLLTIVYFKIWKLKKIPVSRDFVKKMIIC